MRKWVFILISAGIALRLTGIHFGLPAALHPDEPHHINTALYFGSGDLNPHVFKYPTLWMYLLFSLYGIYFVFWSGFGLLHSSADFARLFLWDPSAFYLIARGAAAVSGALAALPVWLAARNLGLPRAGLFAAAGIAFSPVLVENSHYAKPDMLMLLFAALAWMAYLEIWRGAGSLKMHAAAGILTGLAVSSQYTAALLLPLPLLAAWLGKEKFHIQGPAVSYAAMALGFFAGTPFALLDPGTFIRDIGDVVNAQSGSSLGTTERAGACTVNFLGSILGWPAIPGAASAALLAGGTFAGFKMNRRLTILLAAPTALGIIFLASLSSHACSPRYIAALLPAAALLAGHLAELKKPDGRWFFVLLIPWLAGSIQTLPPFFRPDTRNLAKEWVEKNIPPGSVILMDQLHAGPALHITQAQAKRLHEKTAAIGHPRAKYYSYLKEEHPGGGYEILRLKRTAAELASMDRHVEWSQQGYELAEAETGLQALKKQGVQFVIWTSLGATPENSPRLAKFFWELEQKAKLIQEFKPSDSISGPHLKIYRLP